MNMTYLDVVDFFEQNEEKVDVYYMDLHYAINRSNINDSVMAYIILRHNQYFSNIRMMITKMNIILGSTNLIESSEGANIMFSNGIRFIIDNVLFFT
uniref:Uncharacterized protein n=1 Tax=Salix viminalis TaxID=40686 RepID=A0A6N2NJH2_SALVM